MIAGSRRLPVRHLSIRVPWHDAGWAGSVCDKPSANTSCRVLPRIAESKDDAAEECVKSRSFADLPPSDLPPCLAERASFMAPFPITLRKTHPYTKRNPESHGHFLPTRYTMRPYTAACVPFRWMLIEESAELVNLYDLGYQPDREPDLGFGTDWIQDRSNQLVMLDTFFGAVRPEESLCFFYAKDTPLSASARRVIVGVGLVLTVDAPVEYQYSIENPPHRSVLWERNVEHSIRPGFKEGFLFPYRELIEIANEQGLDPQQFLAFAPDEAFWSFSHGSEHVSHDEAIASVLSCLRALERIQDVHSGPWGRAMDWLDRQLNRLWRMRGPFPGFGSALAAFLGDGGNLVAYEIAEESAKSSSDGNIDPWPAFERIIQAPGTASDSVKEQIGEGFARAWSSMTAQRKELLRLLSRFSLTSDQAKRFFNRDGRPVSLDDASLIENPYLLYELDRMSLDSISVMNIDRGMLPGNAVLKAHPLPESSRLTDKVDPRRVRALVVAALEQGAEQGHTLLPRALLSTFIDSMPLESDCPIGPVVLAGVSNSLEGVVATAKMAKDTVGFQLRRFVDTGEMIRRTVKKRVGPKSQRHHGGNDFESAVNDSLGDLPEDSEDAEIEIKARAEKAAALEEIYASRLSVLVGAAGTGKTTLLKMLCELEEVEGGGILLLAPTGKARVQLETRTGVTGGLTIAQFLSRYGDRYDTSTHQYLVTGSPDRCRDYRTVIVDECSMLTEEQLAALLDALSGVDRLVLVGDPRQLPPIGSGRPFVDIVRELEPEEIEHRILQVDRGYAKLTIPRRQRGATRADLLLAGWFGGIQDPAADEIWNRLENEEINEISFESWSDWEDLRTKLLELIVRELDLASLDDEVGFECSLGATTHNGGTFFWRSRAPDAPIKAERWQILSPVRGADHGVANLNRLVQQTFRKSWLSKAMSHSQYRKIHLPVGPQGIIYGDKVINLKNSGDRQVFPKRLSYVANGDVGIVVGNYKTKNQKKLFPFVEVEFTSQPGHDYDFKLGEFGGEEGTPPLELAYALTVHKSQGSEFGITFVVLPDPCWPLSRELLYTALTRQQNRVVVLHQGDLRNLRRYASDKHSDIARRLTNLFSPANPVSFEVEGVEKFLEEGLIHRTKRGDLVRSKSEAIIANELLAQGVDRYEYEAALSLSDGRTRYPDFTVVDDDTGERFYWEHLGLLHNPEYEARWNRKLEEYRAASILPHQEGGGKAGTLIVTRDDERGGIDTQAIADLIRDVLVG
ncbi:MAG: AAA family ATPase [Gammaproteobacteria bacterium]|nr:AAA family ATPase [Gammaproteobacteria bacterium]